MNTQQKIDSQKTKILHLAGEITNLQDELSTLDNYKKSVLEARTKEKENGD